MNTLTVTTHITAPLAEVRNKWTTPDHITHRAFASDDRECPSAQNDLCVGGKFVTTMAAKDGSARFDFGGTYTEVQEGKCIAYTLDDGRTVAITFVEQDDQVQVVETFVPEEIHASELQQAGRQAILDNFKKYVEQTS